MKTFRTLVCFFSLIALSACTGSRGGLVDSVLDRSLYPADTKAERLLRYFEVQALLVRLVSESGGSVSGRNAVAMANIAATDQLNMLVDCLQVGSVSLAHNAPLPSNITPATPIRVNTAYCSFFESRLVNYEESLLSMLRQAARDDPDAKLVENALTGASVLDFATIVSALTQIAGRIIRDEIVLRAFTADALELETLIWQPYTGPNQIPDSCVVNGSACVEGASIEALRSTVATENGGGARPVILVWHFQEVAAFMISACRSLNDDAPLVDGIASTNCSAKLPFGGVGPAASSGPSPVVVRPPPPPPPPPPHQGPAPPPAALTKACSQISVDEEQSKGLSDVLAGSPNMTADSVKKIKDQIAALAADEKKAQATVAHLSPSGTCPPAAAN